MMVNETKEESHDVPSNENGQDVAASGSSDDDYNIPIHNPPTVSDLTLPTNIRVEDSDIITIETCNKLDTSNNNGSKRTVTDTLTSPNMKDYDSEFRFVDTITEFTIDDNNGVSIVDEQDDVERGAFIPTTIPPEHRDLLHYKHQAQNDARLNALQQTQNFVVPDTTASDNEKKKSSSGGSSKKSSSHRESNSNQPGAQSVYPNYNESVPDTTISTNNNSFSSVTGGNVNEEPVSAYLAEALPVQSGEFVLANVVSVAVYETNANNNKEENNTTSTGDKAIDGKSFISSLSGSLVKTRSRLICVIITSSILITVLVGILLYLLLRNNNNTSQASDVNSSNVPKCSPIIMETPTSPPRVFNNNIELEDAVDEFLNNTSNEDYCKNWEEMSRWDVSNISNFTYVFNYLRNPLLYNFSGDISRWNVSKATHLKWMFYRATSFNSNISNWDVQNVVDLTGIFREATAFNSDLSKWDVGRVVELTSVFRDATTFTSDLSNWDVGNVQNMKMTFQGAESFNSNLSKWNVTRVFSMEYMFYKALSFDSDLSGWNVSNITDMRDMFNLATNFKGVGLDKWILHKDVNLSRMFCGAISLDKTYISSWNTTSQNLYC